MTVQRLIVAVGSVSLVLVLVLQGQDHGQRGGAAVLLGRGADVADAMGLPSQLWTGPAKEDGLYNNMGAANLDISEDIKTLDAARHNPNLAAAVHILQACLSLPMAASLSEES